MIASGTKKKKRPGKNQDGIEKNLLYVLLLKMYNRNLPVFKC